MTSDVIKLKAGSCLMACWPRQNTLMTWLLSEIKAIHLHKIQHETWLWREHRLRGRTFTWPRGGIPPTLTELNVIPHPWKNITHNGPLETSGSDSYLQCLFFQKQWKPKHKPFWCHPTCWFCNGTPGFQGQPSPSAHRDSRQNDNQKMGCETQGICRYSS